MIEYANCFLAGANGVLLLMIILAKSSEIEWKQIALKRSESIEHYQRDVRELKSQNEKLNALVDVLRKSDE